MLRKDFYYSISEVDSEWELKVICDKKHATILGVGIDCIQRSYLIKIQYQSVEVFIGLYNEDHGLKPSLVFMDSMELVLIASDNCVYFLYLNNLQDVLPFFCDTLVFEILLPQSYPDIIVVITEIGVECLTSTGALLWGFSCDDIVTDYSIYEHHLEIVTYEGGVYSIALEDGHIL